MKAKVLSFMLSVIIVFSSFCVYVNAQEIKMGDVNKDGNVTAADARTVLRIAAKLDDIADEDRIYADVNSDNKINATDARMVLRAAAKIESLPELSIIETTTKNEENEILGVENYHGHVYAGGASSKKYHYEAECAGKYSHEITWDEVNARGLGPCGTCVLK